MILFIAKWSPIIPKALFSLLWLQRREKKFRETANLYFYDRVQKRLIRKSDNLTFDDQPETSN